MGEIEVHCAVQRSGNVRLIKEGGNDDTRDVIQIHK